MIVVGAVQFLILVVALVRGKALALMLGPEGVGVIGTVDQFVTTVAQLCALGLPFAAMKSMSAAHSESDAAFRRTFTAFARLLLSISAAVAGLALSTELLSHAAFGRIAEYRDILMLALFAVPPTILTILVAHTFASAQMPRAAAVYNLVFAAAPAGAALLGAALGGVWGFYFGTVAGGVLVLVSAFLWLRRRMGLSVLGKGRSAWRELRDRQLVVETAISASANLVSASALLLLVRYVVLTEEGEAAAGYLQSALGVALSAGSILATIASLYLAPSLNRNAPLEDKFRSAAAFARSAAFYMVLGGVPVALFPGLVLTILYADAFTAAALTLILCLIWQGLVQMTSTYTHLLVGIDQPGAATITTLVSAAVGVTAAFLLVAPWGLVAAPVALIVTAVVRMGLITAILVVRSGMPMPWGVFARYLGVAAAIGGAARLFDVSDTIPDAAGFGYRALYALTATGLMWAWTRRPARP